MKRRLLIAAVFLLAGAVVNVAVAWGIVLVPPPHRRVAATGAIVELRRWLTAKTALSSEPIEASVWPRDVPAHWPRMSRANRVRRIGFEKDTYIGDKNGPDHRRTEFFYIDIADAGWPCWSLESEAWLDMVLHRRPSRHEETRRDGQPEHTLWLTGIPVSTNGSRFMADWRRLPIRPRWPGFAVNTLFYAAILWLPFVLRRWLRVRRGQCPKCAYPMGEAAVCTECGKTLPQRARVTT